MAVRRTIGKAEAALILGVSVRQLHRIDEEDDPPPWTGAGYDCERFGEWLKRRYRRELNIADDGQVYDYETERARLTKAQADKTELESQELRGEMVRAAEVVEEWSRMFGSMKARLLTLPGKVAPRARGAESDEVALRLVEAEILQALEELSEDGLPARTRARQKRLADRATAAAEADGKRVGGRLPKAKSRKRKRAGPVDH